MMAMGFAEVLMLALLSGGTNSNDLISLVQPAHYFRTRQIEVSIDKMVSYASEEPKDAKTQIVQLTALRYLADEAEALKKAPNYAAHRQTLEAIAAGKKGRDSLGFAEDYASRVLLKLDNAKPELVKLRPLREDALGWFPTNTTLAAALDLRQSRQFGGADDPLKELLKLMPDEARTEMYSFVEKSGNIRAERVAFGLVDSPGQKEQMKIFLRLTGKGNQDWMAGAFKAIDQGCVIAKHTTDDKNTPITLLQLTNSNPVIILVGNTDLLLLGYPGAGRNAKHEDLVSDVLDARSMKKANAQTGPLKDRLAKVPDKAVALLVGSMPEDMKQEFRFVFDPTPTTITAFIERAPQGLDVQVETSMANGEDAGKVVQKVGELRKQGIAGLQQAMQQAQPPGTPQIPFQTMMNVLESLQVQSQADRVQVRAIVPETLLQTLPAMMGLRSFGGAEKKVEFKK